MRNLDDKFLVFAKSSMDDIDYDYTGRPFGGIAMVCRQSDSLSFHELKAQSNRVLAVAVSDASGSITQIIVSVYLPYYNASPEQTELFIATIDALQYILDEYAMLAPVKICGDMNAQLRKSDQVSKKWCVSTGFNNHSKILYDFMKYCPSYHE